ncbi:MAG: substrate-binding domain-containing protein [Lachnospiraceae bacterium]|nr:substrate-binding domain-containing protein [Lachnospiraceae bacterium]
MKQREEKVKYIGVVVEDVDTDFTKEILHSVAHAIAGYNNIRLVVIAGRHDDCEDPEDRLHRYKQVYNSIYDINGVCRFDGLLLTLPNIDKELYEIFKDVPKVFIATTMENELTVNYNDEMGIRETIDYLVKIKGIINICMIGGRDDNADAQKRKRIFEDCLCENGLAYSSRLYEKSDMSVNSHEAAERLLTKNPGVQAIFCVNDQTASGLYDVMRQKGLVPGKDIIVFGFDNTSMATELVPTLASIGADGVTLGQRALEMLIDKMNGQEVESEVIPTCLYGRDSLPYDMYEYTTIEMLNIDAAFIYRMFDDCFYRYRNEVLDRNSINLKRLFYEIISKMLYALKNRYMGEDQFYEIRRLITIFFQKGAMKYTDPNKFLASVEKLQKSMNETQKLVFVNTRNNRLFSYMKDNAIQAQAYARNMQTKGYTAGRGRMHDLMACATNYGETGEKALDYLFENFGKTGFPNAALYLYKSPVKYEGSSTEGLKGNIYLKCVLRDGELYQIPEERQECSVGDIYRRSELPEVKKGYVGFPLFFGNYVFGIFVCGVDRSLIETGEFLTLQISRIIYTNWGFLE